MRSIRRTDAALLLLALAFTAKPAAAGGFDELPDQGAEALGRGGTFTAKADDATALYYNVAGLARQRGTRIQLTTNVHFNTLTFQRAGSYPDEKTDATPWGGTPFPLVEDKSNPFLLPMLLVTTDLGLFDRLTFGLGIYGPAATDHLFQTGVDGKPSPARYDAGGASENVILFPTLAAGYRLTPQIDIGAALHVVPAALDTASTVFADSGSCPNVEAFSCDGLGILRASGLSATGSVGVLARVAPSIQLGAQLRGPTMLTASGELTQRLGGAELPPSQADVELGLPPVLRVGARYIGMDGKVERYDVELDGTYEAWGAYLHDAPIVRTTIAGQPRTLSQAFLWQDTFSVRLGGAYNISLGSDRLTIRGGTFYDSPTTSDADTKPGANTMAKIAGTVGVGFKHGPIAFSFAYAAVASLGVTVTNGSSRLVNVLGEEGSGGDLPITNNGVYAGFSHVLGFGWEVNLSTLFGGERRPRYGDPQVEVLASDAPDTPAPVKAEPKEEPKQEETKSAEDEVIVEKIEIDEEPPTTDEPKPKTKPKRKPKKPKRKPTKPPPKQEPW